MSNFNVYNLYDSITTYLDGWLPNCRFVASWYKFTKDKFPKRYAYFKILNTVTKQRTEECSITDGVLHIDIYTTEQDKQEWVSEIGERLLQEKFPTTGYIPLNIQSLFTKSTFSVNRGEAGRPVIEGGQVRQSVRIFFLIESIKI